MTRRSGQGPTHAAPHPASAAVVTVFLWDGRRILLALRSASVSTFAGHWAGISGYLEGQDPTEWALREVDEECGVDRTHLTVLRIGDPLSATDPATGRTFQVHPFLCAIDDPALVRPDWEAQRFDWVDVDELRQRGRQPAVPRLYEALDHVWPPWAPDRALAVNLDLACRYLRDDRQLGAGALARAAGWEAAKLVRLYHDSPLSQCRTTLARAIRQIQNTRPTMTPPANLLGEVLIALQRMDSPHALRKAIMGLIQRSVAAEAEVAHRAAQLLLPAARVMTISYSGTVLRTLTCAADKLRRVYICEGRPLLEGRALAAALAHQGLAITLLTDAQAAALMPQVDRVLLGADAVLPDQSIVNKVGSMQLALAARHWSKPVTVVAESLKFLRTTPSSPLPSEENAGHEVWRDPPHGVEVSNTYFETVPADLIEAVVTEHGQFGRPTASG